MAAPDGEAGGGDAGAEGADAFDLTTLEGQLQRLASVLPPDVICTMIVARVAASWDAETVESACRHAAMRGDVRTLEWLFDLDCVPHFGPRCLEEPEGEDADDYHHHDYYYDCRRDLWHSRLADFAIEFVSLEDPLFGGHADVFRWLHRKGFYLGTEDYCMYLPEKAAVHGSFDILEYLLNNVGIRAYDDVHMTIRNTQRGVGNLKVLMPDGRQAWTTDCLDGKEMPAGSWLATAQSLNTPGKVSHRLLRSLQVFLDHGIPDIRDVHELGVMCHDAAEEMILYSARKGHLVALKFFLGGNYDRWGRRVENQNKLGLGSWWSYPDPVWVVDDEPVPWPERDLTGLAKRAFAAAAAGGHLECLKFMHTHFLTQEERSRAFEEEGKGDSISFPVKKPRGKDDIPWDASATEAAVAHEQLLALTFLWAHDCPWSDATRKRAAELGFAPAAQKQLW